MRGLRSAVVGATAAMLVAGQADAAFRGTPGKVAYVGTTQTLALRVWDPYLARAGQTAETEVAPATTVIGGLSIASRPQWSPDGTKLVFTKPVDDPGPSYEGSTPEHTAIFTWDVATGVQRQLTAPPPGVEDPDPDDLHAIGHATADQTPTWSPDGTQVHFVRVTEANTDDPLRPDDGYVLRTVPATASQALGTRRMEFGELETPLELTAIPGDPGAVAMTKFAESELVLGRQALGGGFRTLATDVGHGVDVSPDGLQVAFSREAPDGFSAHVVGMDGSGERRIEGFPGSAAMQSTTGNGPIVGGCLPDRPAVCGLIEVPQDPPGTFDVRPGETGRLVAAFPVNPFAADVQPQELPVLFLPGFLGSEIECGGEPAWPALPRPRTLAMRLQADGAANRDCASARATGRPVATAYTKDVYGTTMTFLDEHFAGRSAALGWDWRRTPQANLLAVDEQVRKLLDTPRAKAQGVQRVALWGHSYGGLLIKQYLRERPARVGRVLTFGTPWWGSPKAVFPLAFGVESPQFSEFDALFDNAELKSLAVDLAGLHQLLPSDSYGAWLRFDGATRDQDGVRSFITDVLGGNGALVRAARENHASVFDGFDDDGGRVDVRALVGVGEPTVTGVAFTRDDDGELATSITLGDGDGTVPTISAAQRRSPTAVPMGDPVHVQHACRAEHVPLPVTDRLLRAYREFLDVGRTPQRLDVACPYSATVLTLPPQAVQQPVGARAAARAPRATGAPLTPTEAELQDAADVLRTPGRSFLLLDDHEDVAVRFSLQGETFDLRKSAPEGDGPTLRFGPVTGEVVVAPPAAPGAVPEVTQGGAALTGEPVEDGGGLPPPATDTPVPGADTGGGGGGGGTVVAPAAAAPAAGARVPAATTTPPRSRLLATRRGRRITGRLLGIAPACRAGRSVVAAAGRRTLARARTTRAGRFTLRLRRAPRGRVVVRVAAKRTAGRRCAALRVTVR